jgi:hypothetical protein
LPKRTHIISIRLRRSPRDFRSGMRALDGEMAAPALDDNLGLGEAVDYLPVKTFIPALGSEALTTADLPRAPGLNAGRLRAAGQPSIRAAIRAMDC